MPITNALTPDIIQQLVKAANSGNTNKQSVDIPDELMRFITGPSVKNAALGAGDFMSKIGGFLGLTQGQQPQPADPGAAPAQDASVDPNAGVDPSAGMMPAADTPAMPALPQYDGSGIGKDSDSLRQIGGIMQLLGLGSANYLNTAIPQISQHLQDQQTADANSAYGRQQGEYEDQLQANQMQMQDATRRDTARINEELRRDALKQKGDEFNLTRGRLNSMAFDHISQGMLREMQQAYDPSDPAGSAAIQQQILVRDTPALRSLNPDFDPTMYYGKDGNFTPVVDQNKASGTEKNNAVIHEHKVHTLREALSSIGSPGFWALTPEYRQSAVHQLEAAADIPIGTLGTPVDGQSFADKMRRLGVENAVKRTKDQEVSDAWHHVVATEGLRIRQSATDSNNANQASEIDHRTWQENGGTTGKDPNSMSLHELATLRNSTRSQVLSFDKELTDRYKMYTRSDADTAELVRSKAAAQSDLDTYDKMYQDKLHGATGNSGNVSGNAGDATHATKFIGVNTGEDGCVRLTQKIMSEVGHPVPKTQSAKEFEDQLPNTGWERTTMDKAAPNDIIVMPGRGLSGRHTGVFAKPGYMVDNPGQRSGYKGTMSPIPGGKDVHVYHYVGTDSPGENWGNGKSKVFKRLPAGIVNTMSKKQALQYMQDLISHKMQTEGD